MAIFVTGFLVLLPGGNGNAAVNHTCSATERQFLGAAQPNMAALGGLSQDYLHRQIPQSRFGRAHISPLPGKAAPQRLTLQLLWFCSTSLEGYFRNFTASSTTRRRKK